MIIVSSQKRNFYVKRPESAPFTPPNAFIEYNFSSLCTDDRFSPRQYIKLIFTFKGLTSFECGLYDL